MGMYAVQAADPAMLADLRDSVGAGRAAAVARRRSLSAGKDALGPAAERVRTGTRSADLPNGRQPTFSAPAPSTATSVAPAPAGTSPAPTPAPTRASGGTVVDAQVGRLLSIQRRRQLSQGQRGLSAGSSSPRPAAPPAPPAATPGPTQPPSGSTVVDAQVGRLLSIQRRRQLSQGQRGLGAGSGSPRPPAPPAPPAAAPGPTQPPSGSTVVDAQVGRLLSIQRRRQLSQGQRGLSAGSATSALADEPSEPAAGANLRPEPQGRVEYAAKVTASRTQGGREVTGIRIGSGLQVTGDERGRGVPVSGSQYVAADGAVGARPAAQKVGLARTRGGLVVSGTTVRNTVSITGDEFGEHLPITGSADQKLDDDLTPRSGSTYASVQFPSRAVPHGASVYAGRRRPSGTGFETSVRGHAVSGTAVGCSDRVTGNWAGAARAVTGDQYQGVISTTAGGGAQQPNGRPDAVTGRKVSESRTWGGQRVTGPEVEHLTTVTGDEPGVCRPVTGTPYHGPGTSFGWCEPGQSESAAARLDPRPQGVSVTGNVPMHANAVTGTERGRTQPVTGSAYHHDMREAEPVQGPWSDSPVFPGVLARRGRPEPAEDEADGGQITGSFAVGEGKVTGNNEFLYRARARRDAQPTPVTGEGSVVGRTITGSSWTHHDRVTGTEGYIASGRNPSKRGGGTQGWAGARKFSDMASDDSRRQRVTGQSGVGDNASVRITLSGGAQA